MERKAKVEVDPADVTIGSEGDVQHTARQNNCGVNRSLDIRICRHPLTRDGMKC